MYTNWSNTSTYSTPSTITNCYPVLTCRGPGQQGLVRLVWYAFGHESAQMGIRYSSVTGSASLLMRSGEYIEHA